jgi:hypothetical protein
MHCVGKSKRGSSSGHDCSGATLLSTEELAQTRAEQTPMRLFKRL